MNAAGLDGSAASCRYSAPEASDQAAPQVGQSHESPWKNGVPVLPATGAVDHVPRVMGLAPADDARRVNAHAEIRTFMSAIAPSWRSSRLGNCTPNRNDGATVELVRGCGRTPWNQRLTVVMRSLPGWMSRAAFEYSADPQTNRCWMRTLAQVVCLNNAGRRLRLSRSTGAAAPTPHRSPRAPTLLPQVAGARATAP